MRTLRIPLIAGLFLVLFAAPVAAQQGPPQRRMPAQADSLRQRMMPCDMMMRHMSAGMMGRSSDSTRAAMQMMMADPLMRSAMLLRTLPALGDTLGLSAEQAANLQRYRDEYQQKRQETTAAIADKHRELQAAFAAAEPDPDRVRDLLEEAADLRAELMALGYETSVRMQRALTDEQRARLTAMQPMQMQRRMGNMNRAQMMEMMDDVCMMQSGMMGMMQGGMSPGMQQPMQGQQNRPDAGHRH